MGMGYTANYADVTNEEFIKQQCLLEFEDFIQSLSDEDISLEEFSQKCQCYSKKEKNQNPYKAYQALCEAFHQKTELDLYLDYHNPHNGDRYDDVAGLMWCVEGVYRFTPAGKKYQQYIERMTWVSFG